MPQLAEVFTPEPVEHAAPELAVAADVVVAVRIERLTPCVEPELPGLVAQVLPDSLRIPVLLFLGDEAAALEDEDASRRVRQRVGDRAAARAGPDDDDVEGQQ